MEGKKKKKNRAESSLIPAPFTLHFIFVTILTPFRIHVLVLPLTVFRYASFFFVSMSLIYNN